MINAEELREERFIVDDDQKAEWCLNKLKELDSEKEKWVTFYEMQKKKAVQNCEYGQETFKTMLNDYFMTIPHKETKTQESYSLPSGKLVLKKERTEFEKVDEEALLEWCKKKGKEFIKVSESVKWADLKARIKDSGELPEGVEVVTKPAEFKVEGLK